MTVSLVKPVAHFMSAPSMALSEHLDVVDARQVDARGRARHATSSPGFGLTREIESNGLALWDIAAGHLVEVTLSGAIRTTDSEGGEETRTFGITHETKKLE